MDNTLITIPTVRDTVDQTFLLEPLGGPRDVFYYLDRFPEEIYHKSPDTHLYKFMRSLLGESGVNWLRKNHLEARIKLEEIGIDLFDLDNFYGNVFQFGRIVEESFDEDPYGLINKSDWEQIRAKNARYRNRAMDFIAGARAGNTPYGMRLVAKSGLGHDVEIIENYKYLYDIHSDDPLGLSYFGKTTLTEEMVVLPRREIGRSEVQSITISGDPSPPNSGSFSLIYGGINTADFTYDYNDGISTTTLNRIPYTATRDHVRLALESLPAINPGDVYVEGGPIPNSFTVKFQGRLANRDIAQIEVDPFSLQDTLDNSQISAVVTTLYGGQESTEEVVNIPARDKWHLQDAIDRIRPQTMIMTLAEGRGVRERNNWNTQHATSEYTQVVRYVTGSPTIHWPPPSPSKPTLWIESQIEKEAPRIANDLQHHYTGFHNISSVSASTEQITINGPITADRALADYVEPLMVTSATELSNGDAASFINGIYPIEYQDIPGSPDIRYKNDQYWSSAERPGEETLTLGFDSIRASNYLALDIYKGMVEINVDYDVYDEDATQLFVPVTPVEPYSNTIVDTPDLENPWVSIGLMFTNSMGDIPFTSSLKIRFTRLGTYTGSIRVKNLRVARNLANAKRN